MGPLVHAPRAGRGHRGLRPRPRRRGGRLRRRVPRRLRRRPPGRRQESPQQQRPGGAGVHGGGGGDRARPPQAPGPPAGLLRRGRAPDTGVRVCRQWQPGAVAPRRRRAGQPAVLGRPDERRARHSQRDHVPARGAGAEGGAPGHQVQQHPAGQAVEPQGVRLRPRQAPRLRQQLRHHQGHGNIRLCGAGVREHGHADGEERRVQLRGARHGDHLRPVPRRLRQAARGGESGGVAEEDGEQQGVRGGAGPEAAGEAELQGAEEGAPGGAEVRGPRLAEAAQDGARHPHARGRRLPLPRGSPDSAAVPRKSPGESKSSREAFDGIRLYQWLRWQHQHRRDNTVQVAGELVVSARGVGFCVPCLKSCVQLSRQFGNAVA